MQHRRCRGLRAGEKLRLRTAAESTRLFNADQRLIGLVTATLNMDATALCVTPDSTASQWGTALYDKPNYFLKPYMYQLQKHYTGLTKYVCRFHDDIGVVANPANYDLPGSRQGTAKQLAIAKSRTCPSRQPSAAQRDPKFTI